MMQREQIIRVGPDLFGPPAGFAGKIMKLGKSIFMRIFYVDPLAFAK